MIISVLILNFFNMGFLPLAAIGADGYYYRSMRPSVLSSVRPFVCPSRMSISLHEFQLSSWVLVGFCKVPWRKSVSKIILYAHPFSAHSTEYATFFMIGLYQVWATTLLLILFKDFSYRPEIWWEDAQYHEAPRYLNGYARVMFACQPNFEFFSWLAWARKVSHFRKYVRKSHYCLKFGGIIQCTMKQITVSNLWCSRPRVLSCCERRVPLEKSFDCE